VIQQYYERAHIYHSTRLTIIAGPDRDIHWSEQVAFRSPLMRHFFEIILYVTFLLVFTFGLVLTDDAPVGSAPPRSAASVYSWLWAVAAVSPWISARARETERDRERKRALHRATVLPSLCHTFVCSGHSSSHPAPFTAPLTISLTM
jgi:hypothetical protein